MKHRPRPEEQDDLLRPRLIDLIDPRHELVKLAALIDWEVFEREWAGFFPSGKGRPATEPRLVAGLLYLQHAYRLSDEAMVARWVENPYYQQFTGETFFQHRPPIDPSSLTRWRGRIGEEGVEWLLTQTIQAGQKSGVIDEDSAKRVAVDTTVMEKNIAYPTDARLYERARGQLAELAQEAGVDLRQSYARLAPRLALQVGRYAHAKQFKRMRKALKRLKGYTGRVMRDLRRHLQDISEGGLRDRIIAKLALVSQLLHQQPKGGDKIYALHEPEVDCISKGKARVRYEFGCKVTRRAAQGVQDLRARFSPYRREILATDVGRDHPAVSVRRNRQGNPLGLCAHHARQDCCQRPQVPSGSAPGLPDQDCQDTDGQWKGVHRPALCLTGAGTVRGARV